MGLDGRIVLWNDSAAALLGIPRAEVIGRPCWEVLAGYDEHGVALCRKDCPVMRQVSAGQPVASFTMRSRTRADGAVVLGVSTLSGRADRSGRVLVMHLLRHVPGRLDLLDAGEVGALDKEPGTADTRLTTREMEILRLTKDGEGTRAIAERLGVRPATVRNHTQNILRKLGAHSRLEAVARATRRRLLLP